MVDVDQVEKKEDMFRSIGDTVDAVNQEEENDDGPQIMDNIGARFPSSAARSC